MAVPLQYDVCPKEVGGDSSESSQPPTNKWYFSRQEIEFHTPSRSDGIDYELEEHLRKLYSSFLQELGMKLEVPQVTIAIAMIYCHRFYMRQSHAKNDWQTVATACMFLACKAEETPRWLNKLVVVAYLLIFKWDPSASRRIREIYDKQKELILIAERLLLHVLAYDLNIEHPYKSLVSAFKRLGMITHKDLTKVAWNFVNDWLHTSLCLQHKPHYIAAGSLFLAAKVMKVNLPTSKGKTWWMEFEVSPKQLEGVIQQMMRLLEQSKSQGQSLVSKNQKVAEPPIRKATTATPNCEKKEAFEIVHETTEATKSQTSDTGSGVSVVEDGDIGEPVTLKSDLSSSSKIVSVGGMLGNNLVVDVDKIKEKLKNRNLIKSMKRKHVEEGMDDGEDWIERELENGIVLQSTYPEKRRKI